MKKLILSAVAAAAIAASAFTLTAIAAPDGPPPQDGPGHARFEPGFILDAKLAGMKAALKLTPDQEKLWPPFEAAVLDAHKARMEAMHAMREEREADERPSPIARMTEISDHLAKASEEIKKIADSAKPLYDSLDDGQKRHFGPLVMMLRGGHEGGPGGWHGGEHEPGPL